MSVAGSPSPAVPKSITLFRPLGPGEAAHEFAIDDHDIIDKAVPVQFKVIDREVGIDGTDLF
jgi:hypothetical protein